MQKLAKSILRGGKDNPFVDVRFFRLTINDQKTNSDMYNFKFFLIRLILFNNRCCMRLSQPQCILRSVTGNEVLHADEGLLNELEDVSVEGMNNSYALKNTNIEYYGRRYHYPKLQVYIGDILWTKQIQMF
jgi:hypothetical protein